MKRGTRCVAQTINLSNPRTCIRPSQVQKLVSSDIMEPCPDFNAGGTYWTPKPITVRVCTRKEMERTCQPKLCDCPETKPLTTGQKLCRVLVFVMKSAVVAGFIYWTQSEGMWGDSAETEELYYRMMGRIAPTMLSDSDSADINLPHLETMKYRILQGYNHTVLKVMDIFVGVPLRLHQKIRDMLASRKQEEDEKNLEGKQEEAAE